MKTLACRTAAVLLLLLTAGTALEAYGQPAQLAPRLLPGHNTVTQPPLLGYSYQVIPGYGFQVTGVLGGTPAARIGLELGDVILSINGHRLTHYGADVPARILAARHGGWVTLRIRDVRTGLFVTRSTNLFHQYHPIGPVGPVVF